MTEALHGSVKPSFFIVGTMKGGTTVLYEFICMHEQVESAVQKEIHYFSLYPYKGMQWYMDHFRCPPDKITGEASPSYFDLAYTNAIPQSIKEFNPDAKIIVITRDPVERAISHFYHLRNINKVPLLQDMDINEFFDGPFASCITLTDARENFLHQTLYFSSYARKAMFYRNAFPRENLLFLRNEDLRASARSTMERVFSFLGLNGIYSREFEKLKYSVRRNMSELAPELRNKLSRFFAKDQEAFARVAGSP
ncbi:MAG: sulfotransferase domain-containing protein [Thermoanaerobaculia bacterium]